MLTPVARAAEEPAPAVPGCADPDHPGGDWPMYGRDLSNSRTQPLETVIGPDNVLDLEPAWIVSTDDAGGADTRGFAGELNSTPVVAHGCVFVAASLGYVDALNADTGETVWSTEVEINRPAFGGGVVGTPAVDDERVYVIVNDLGRPYVVGLTLATGAIEWLTVIETSQGSAMTNASIVLYDGLILAGFSGGDSPPADRGGFTILEAATGEVVTTTYTIPMEDYEQGYGGASIWSTAAVDTEAGYAYVGTGNPHSLQQEHELTNSLIKIDLDRDRETFGEIVGAYKGQPDSYVEGAADQPVCEHFGDSLVLPGFGFSIACVQLDLDFGASPNLFEIDGRKVIGALQKSGVFHTVDADTMEPEWDTVIGAPCLACNSSSAAFDGEQLYVAAGPPAFMYGLEPDDGAYGWVAPVATGVTHYSPVTYANGVVYTLDGSGYLNAFDADTGLPLLKRDMMLDTGGFMFAGSSSSGIAVARNTVYVVTTAGYVLAYRL